MKNKETKLQTLRDKLSGRTGKQITCVKAIHKPKLVTLYSMWGNLYEGSKTFSFKVLIGYKNILVTTENGAISFEFTFSDLRKYLGFLKSLSGYSKYQSK